MLDFDCTSKHLKRKKCRHQNPIQNLPENRRFWQLLYKNVQAILMAQHSLKDCGHLRVFLWNICFAMFFPFLNVGGPANITLRTPLSVLVCISQEKECRNYFRRRQKVMKKTQRIISECNASHFKKLWFCPFTLFGTISKQRLECVQRFLIVLFHSHFLAQAVSNGRFWLKESDFGPGK